MTGGLQMDSPKIIVFDSGLGGFTVYRELQRSLPAACYLYVADSDAFPYGDLQDDELVARLLALFEVLIEREKPDICVIACNTASTISLDALRAHFKVPFVGVVPAVKTAAETTKTGLFSVLATPGTVKRDYTIDLVERYADACEVALVGAPKLANLAEQFMRGEEVDEVKLLQEINPAFVERKGQRTDIIVLGCTHYPLLVEKMRQVAPWPVTYIDPAPAIARRTSVVLSQRLDKRDANDCKHANILIYTGKNNITENIAAFLQKIGLADVYRDEIIG